MSTRAEKDLMFDCVRIPAPAKKNSPAAPAPSATSPSLSDYVSTRDKSFEEMTAHIPDDEKGTLLPLFGTSSSADEESDDDVLPSFTTPTTCPPSSATIPAAAFVADYCDHCRGRFEYPLKQYDTPLGVRQLCGACHKGE